MIIRNTRKKSLFSRLQNQNGIVTPPLPLNAVVAQRGASCGIYQREKKRTNLRCGSRSARPASIANGVPFAAENGRTRAPFWFAGKRLASNRQPIHIGSAKPTWRQTASQFTSARQSRPKYRDLQYLQIGVKIRIREKSWSQKKKKLQLSPIIWEI